MSNIRGNNYFLTINLATKEGEIVGQCYEGLGTILSW